MIRKFIKRCFLAGMLIVAFVIGTVACCWFLASANPSFYAAALGAPVDEADVEAAVKEVEKMVSAMEMFVMLDAVARKKLQTMPEQAMATTQFGRPTAQVSLAEALETLEDSQGETQDTFVLALSERQLNACLHKEIGSQGGNLQRPYVSLHDEMIRFAVTLITPAADLALSCDFVLAKTKQTNLTFELHSLSVGKLPLPATAILKQCMRVNPALPPGVELNIDGEHPTLSITALPDNGRLLLEDLNVANGTLHLTFRRNADAMVAANRGRRPHPGLSP